MNDRREWVFRKIELGLQLHQIKASEGRRRRVGASEEPLLLPVDLCIGARLRILVEEIVLLPVTNQARDAPRCRVFGRQIRVGLMPGRVRHPGCRILL